ncbi:hypothetical protein Tco_1136438 [Tanacetum coccineum]
MINVGRGKRASGVECGEVRTGTAISLGALRTRQLSLTARRYLGYIELRSEGTLDSWNLAKGGVKCVGVLAPTRVQAGELRVERREARRGEVDCKEVARAGGSDSLDSTASRGTEQRVCGSALGAAPGED